MKSWKNFRGKDAKMHRGKVSVKRLKRSNSVSCFPFTIHSLAFTLAEILITLGIIGVVAAMTIPSLMQNIQDRQFKTAAMAAYSKASQAVQQIKNDNGGDLSGYNSSNFKNVFIQYFKIAKDCNQRDCTPIDGSGLLTTYTSLSGKNIFADLVTKGQFVSTDGQLYAIANVSPIIITVDVNGEGNPPNVYGRDVFLFEIVNGTLVPEGAKNTSWPAGSNCKRASSYTSDWYGAGCMEYVMEGKDY